MPPFLSLVIPAYNEAGRLPRNLPLVAAYCQTLALPAPGGWEVLAVVERSTDGTLDKARAAARAFPQIQVIDNGPQRGKGHAVRAGMLRAAGDIVLFMDADLSTPLTEIEGFLAWFAAHPETDVLIGNRRHAGSRIGRPQGWLRRHLSGVFNGLVKGRVLGGGWTDTQCGFKAFRAPAARAVAREGEHGRLWIGRGNGSTTARPGSISGATAGACCAISGGCVRWSSAHYANSRRNEH